jgi:NitT/TauT family transport system ATP-binding protein
VATSAAPLLDVQGVTIQYKTSEQLVTATWKVGFQADRSERLVLLGPSGCGKSTLLKAIGGYLTPTEGSITLDGRTITGPGPDRVMVFQETEQLLPWKTVRQNVAFALTASNRATRRDADEQAMVAIRTVKLEKFADAYPHTLSGGMKQRVAIARCLAMEPEIVLMDEPFAALDALTRQQMQEELLELWSRSKFTMVFVTHSIEEAILLGNRIVLLSPHPGQVKEILDVDLDDPGNRFHGRFNELRDTIHRVLFKDVGDYVI